MPHKILVVDDEEDVEILIRQNFKRKIRRGEIEFFFANNGNKALEILKLQPGIDMILSDINMPGMDGLVLLSKTTQLYPLCRTVVVSAYGDMKNIRTAMNNGAFDFVTKPINFEDLETTISKTLQEVESLKNSAQEKNRLLSLEKELQIGQKIQNTFLPSKLPQIEGWEISSKFFPAKDVSGDFYDAFQLQDKNIICFTIADVCDKGVGAALYMSLFRSLIRAYSKLDNSSINGADKIIKLTHDYIYNNHGDSGMFATMFFGHLDTTTGKVAYVNGGHNPPFIIKKNGELINLDRTGPAVGVLPGSTFNSNEFLMEVGDIFFSFTDGVIEAVNPKKILYDTERLLNVIKEDYNSSEDLLNAVEKSVREHIADEEQFDDITMLAICRKE